MCNLYSSQLVNILAFAIDMIKAPFAFLTYSFAPMKRRRKECPKEKIMFITVWKNREVGKDQNI